jgi:hypothetical protein
MHHTADDLHRVLLGLDRHVVYELARPGARLMHGSVKSRTVMTSTL